MVRRKVGSPGKSLDKTNGLIFLQKGYFLLVTRCGEAQADWGQSSFSFSFFLNKQGCETSTRFPFISKTGICSFLGTKASLSQRALKMTHLSEQAGAVQARSSRPELAVGSRVRLLAIHLLNESQPQR